MIYPKYNLICKICKDANKRAMMTNKPLEDDQFLICYQCFNHYFQCARVLEKLSSGIVVQKLKRQKVKK